MSAGYSVGSIGSESIRLTRRNPSAAVEGKHTYRIPFASGKRWTEDKSIGERVILGEVADKLGRYEDLGEPEEIQEKIHRLEELQKRVI